MSDNLWGTGFESYYKLWTGLKSCVGLFVIKKLSFEKVVCGFSELVKILIAYSYIKGTQKYFTIELFHQQIGHPLGRWIKKK